MLIEGRSEEGVFVFDFAIFWPYRSLSNDLMKKKGYLRGGGGA